jgi:TolB-like protein/Flp pilus assembly protein TadD
MIIQNSAPCFGGDGHMTPNTEAIMRQMTQILESPDFRATKLQRAFLEFVVTKTIAGESDEIKGYTVATEVFDRNEDFDQSVDPIVSIHANKLRRALERYYLTAGANDPLIIDIPKGSYVPTFSVQEVEAPEDIIPGLPGRDPQDSPLWPTVLIRPLTCLKTETDMNYLSIGIATQIGIELSRHQDVRAIVNGPKGYGQRATDIGTRFVLDGYIREDDTGISLTFYLEDTDHGTQVWGDTFTCPKDDPNPAAFEEEVAHIVAVKVAGEYGVIADTLAPECRDKQPMHLSTYEAILRYHEFQYRYDAKSLSKALHALEHASKTEPQCGRVWAMLGRLYGDIYGLALPGHETALEKAVESAEQGVRRSPNNQRARLVLAYIRMLENQLQAGISEASTALSLNPNSLFFIDAIGYILTLLGDWERGRAIIHRCMLQDPCYGHYVHHALWVDWMRQKKFEQASLETHHFYRPSLFWEPLMKAAAFGQAGRFEEGRQAVQNLLALKPDFPDRGRILIGHYIKYDDIAGDVIDGLGKVGLKI